jgi:2-oxoisovalerate dehydrogenase E2 component (dihydrolipoyl transacylase)
MVAKTFALPDLGEGLEEATVDTWLVAEGDTVELNQPIAEIETAKATVEVPSPFAGRVLRLHPAAGGTLRVGEALVTVDVEDGGEDEDTAASRSGTTASVAAAPAVRAFAKETGLDLSSLTGTGPGGRITREDVERASSAPRGSGSTGRRRPLTSARRTAAERLSRAAAVPTVTTWRTLDCTALELVRAEGGRSPLPYVVRALADVCRRHPAINASWAGGAIVEHDEVHVGIATDTDRGLLVPVVRDAGALGIGAIAARIAGLATAARDGSIAPADLSGHTITVTNTGSYGSEAGTPLLNLPDAAILAFGLIEPRALVVGGAVEARPACTLSVTFDHRVLDGAAVGRALNDFIAILEDETALRALPD